MATPAERIPVGYVRRAHGLRGEVLVRLQSDDPNRFRVGASFLTDEEPPRTLTVADVREHNEGLLLRFVEIADRNTAEALRGVSLTISPEERRDLEADEFWPEDLQGLPVFDAAGNQLGTVSAVTTGGAQDRLTVVTPGSSTVEVPFVAAIVYKVDLALGRIEMDPPPGLFSD